MIVGTLAEVVFNEIGATTDGELKGARSYGIYEFDGDTIKICLTQGDKKDRPTTFESKPGAMHSLSVLKKVKP